MIKDYKKLIDYINYMNEEKLMNINLDIYHITSHSYKEDSYKEDPTTMRSTLVVDLKEFIFGSVVKTVDIDCKHYLENIKSIVRKARIKRILNEI